jgi:pyridinium-3,5-bisthiocarboxylic acid mononucleotide nickel chelatase
MSLRHAWIDATAGIAGDMLLGALIDAGAGVDRVQRAVDAVVPDAVRLTCIPVTRAGQHATKVQVEPIAADVPDRRWPMIRQLILAADLAPSVRDRSLRTFARLSDAEAQVHGIAVEDVHFHEVGALDSIADVVGVAAALHALDVDTLGASAVAVGAGRVQTAHGELGVPVPAVVQLASGWRIFAGGAGELTTPTGMALLAALSKCEDLPPLSLERSGSGAGTKDTPGRPNLTRVLIGSRESGTDLGDGEPAVLLETNVDDFDPRLWPTVLSSLLAAGAADAWLTPIVMKKGRPAHTLSALARPDQSDQLRDLILNNTSSIGIRRTHLHRWALPRGWTDIRVGDRELPVKVSHRDGVIWQVTPEFEELDLLASDRHISPQVLLDQTRAAASAAGLIPGASVPGDLRSHRDHRISGGVEPSDG